MKLIVILLLSVFVFEHRLVEALSVSPASEGPTVIVTEPLQQDNVTKDSDSGYGSEEIDRTDSTSESNHTDASILENTPSSWTSSPSSPSSSPPSPSSPSSSPSSSPPSPSSSPSSSPPSPSPSSSSPSSSSSSQTSR
ncbi:unnamed protein product [Schistosoma intercalatum]|nr:unnamed protein product [Schistosoma intercalatum]